MLKDLIESHLTTDLEKIFIAKKNLYSKMQGYETGEGFDNGSLDISDDSVSQYNLTNEKGEIIQNSRGRGRDLSSKSIKHNNQRSNRTHSVALNSRNLKL